MIIEGATGGTKDAVTDPPSPTASALAGRALTVQKVP